MHNKQKLTAAIALIASSGVIGQAHAALPDNAILNFDTGVTGGYYGFILSGSYFAMDTTGDGVFGKGERVGLSQNAGITVGKAQAASGTHTGGVNGSESPGADNGWEFFGNTGLHQSTTPVTLISTSGNTATLDFSGWNVTWNAIPSIPMGAGLDNGVATVTCAVDCSDGDTYTLDYFATVPVGDISGFGGVSYTLHLLGSISIPPPLDIDDGTFAVGSVAQSVGSTDSRISFDDLLNNGGVDDSGFTYASGLVDFAVTGLAGTTVSVVIQQSAPIPADATYRKFINGAWIEFVPDIDNKVSSAVSAAGACPVVNDAVYDHTNGLVEGDDCVQITILDGGPYDADATATNIADPSGVATAVQTQVDNRTSGTSGCSISNGQPKAIEHADWLLVAAFIGFLGVFGYKRERNS